MEKVVEHKQCKKCGVGFEITDKDLEFYDKVSPIFGWEKYSIPSPTLCPDCRQQRRLSFRNERKLYKRKCDATGRDIISIYSPDKEIVVYDKDFWWSDKWDPLEYWKEFDFSKPFFEQFNGIVKKIPKKNLHIKGENYNSDYCNIAKSMKDCYLSFAAAECENILYSNWIGYSKSSLDISYGVYTENSYNLLDVEKVFNSSNIFNSKHIDNSMFLYNCVNCKNCIFSTNLVNKAYYIFNKEYQKDEYQKIRNQILADPDSLKKYDDIVQSSIRKNLDCANSENVFWDHIFNSKNVSYWFDVYHIDQGKYIYDGWWGESLMDYYEFFDNCVCSYEWQEMWKASFSLFNNYSYDVSNIIYCFDCHFSSNLFGCVWLKNKQYCIFNKQYTKEQYEELVPKIIGHMKQTWEWWEFFPASISPFGYNETVAQEYFPLSRKQVQEQWFNWSDYEQPFPNVEEIISANKLPENISDIPDDILNWAIECEITQKPFRIIGQELEFYRKHNLPVPKRHPDQRHLDRMKLRNPRKLFERNCDKCGVEMETTYAPDRTEKVYCEKCYIKIIY